MKTKFVLHGGFNSAHADRDNSDFYKEILKDIEPGATILLVPFAKDYDRIETATANVSSQFLRNKGEKEIKIEVATPDTFIEKLNNADVVYFHGGVSSRLLEILKQYPDLAELLIGKTVAGESAGANVLGKFFYSPHADEVFEGLGIVPFKIIPHYKEEYANKLDLFGEDLGSLLLPEYMYKVLYSMKK